MKAPKSQARMRTSARLSPAGPAIATETGVRAWFMDLIERYIFRIAFSAFVGILVALTAVIWITQALEELDLLTSKGQTILMFLTVTGPVDPDARHGDLAGRPVHRDDLHAQPAQRRFRADRHERRRHGAAAPLAPVPRARRGRLHARRVPDPLRDAGELPGTARPHHQDPRRFRRQHRQGRTVHRARQRHHLPFPRAFRRGAARHLHPGQARAGQRPSPTSPSAARSPRRTGRATSSSRAAPSTGKRRTAAIRR